MVGFARDEEGGRRLPQWMLGGGAAASQSRKSDDVNKNENVLGEVVQSQASLSKATHRARNSEKGLGTENEPKRMKISRISSQRGEDCDGHVPAGVLVKKDKETVGRKRKIVKDASASERENKVQAQSGDDVELTVSDLMIIAKEYVEGNKDMMQKQVLKGELESSFQLPTTASFRSRADGSLNSTDNNLSSLTYKATASYDLTSEKTSMDASKMGDPALEMLELYLGPLFKKPTEKGKRLESITMDMDYSCDFVGQRQNDKVPGEVIPMEKKKSSLKDKVAMFLD